MKRILFFLTLAFLPFLLTAQTVAKKDASGNYTQVDAPPKTVEQLTANAQKSAAMFTDKAGKTHPVYLSASGKTFYIATSKAGKPYRKYFKTIE